MVSDRDRSPQSSFFPEVSPVSPPPIGVPAGLAGGSRAARAWHWPSRMSGNWAVRRGEGGGQLGARLRDCANVSRKLAHAHCRREGRKEGRRDYCATFTFLQRDTERWMTREGGGSGEPPPPPPSGQERQCARIRFEQIQRGVKAVAGRSARGSVAGGKCMKSLFERNRQRQQQANAPSPMKSQENGT